MALPNQATPTLQANIQGTRTTVNLRDWLNARLSPFLKKAIIDSLDAEAEYPLQWLGEHLIQQSILFEGNPDTTEIASKFRYNHESAAKSTQIPASHTPSQAAPESVEPMTAEATSAKASTSAAVQNGSNGLDDETHPTANEEKEVAASAETADHSQTENTKENGNIQDTEMTDTT